MAVQEAFIAFVTQVDKSKFNALLFPAFFSKMDAVTHANHRILYGTKITEAFTLIRSFLYESFCRANTMKLYSLRAMDYFRMMSAKDRRYLLFNPIIKSKVTREGDKVLRLIMDVVYAQLILEAATLYDVEEELVDQIFAHFIRSTASNALAQINSQKSSDVQDDCFWNIAKVVLTVDKESFHTITVFANVLERMAAKQNNIDFLAVSYGELVAAVSDVYKTNVVCVEVCPADE